MASCPERLWPRTLIPYTAAWMALPCDVGVVQTDELHVDAEATGHALALWNSTYDERVGVEVDRLRRGFRAVLGDVPPLAFDAARAAGVPAFALANFTWDWIYERMGFPQAAANARAAYAGAELVFELEPAAPMTAFDRRVPVGVLGRPQSRPRHAIRRALGVEAHHRLVLVGFRNPDTCLLPEPATDVRYLLPGPHAPRADLVVNAGDVDFNDMMGAADVVVAKAGYGIVADSAACGTPLLYTLRSGFPEDEVLGRWLAERPACRFVSPYALSGGAWFGDLAAVLCEPRQKPVVARAIDAAADRLASALAD